MSVNNNFLEKIEKWEYSKEYQTIILDVKNYNYEDAHDQVEKTLKTNFEQLREDGILWIVCSNKKENGIFQPIPFLLAEELLNKGLKLKNIIIWPDFKDGNNSSIFIDITNYILFFTKSDNYHFNIDPIRESHIWKDVEWGKRNKNYHEKGKNPGNVWIKTKDDGKGNITEHIPLSYIDMIERILKCSSRKYYSVLLKNIENQKGLALEGVKIVYEK